MMLGLIQTTPEEFENGGFRTLILPINTTHGKFKNATTTGHFKFVFDKNSVRKMRHRFQKVFVSKCFRFTRKQKPAFSNSSDLKNVSKSSVFLTD